MRATGIVRRVDDLGRIVIPKEIRRTLHIKEGTAMEYYIDKDILCIKKYYAGVQYGEALIDIAHDLREAMDDTFETQENKDIMLSAIALIDQAKNLLLNVGK